MTTHSTIRKLRFWDDAELTSPRSPLPVGEGRVRGPEKSVVIFASSLGRSRRVLRWRRTGFTLVELLVSILVISILASLVLFAMAGAVDKAHEAQTKSRIARIDRVISRMWNDFETRRVPIRIAPGTDPRVAAAIRLDAIRELMRLELPDRITDVRDGPYVASYSDSQLVPMVRPALSAAYLRSIPDSWDVDLNNVTQAQANEALRFQGAECLYLILSKAKDGDRPAIASFSEESFGDVDGDGMPEILDAWGSPIEFLRWPAGLRSFPTINSVSVPDPFDRRRADPRFRDADPTNDPFLLYPLIYSPGSDRGYNIAARDPNGAIHYSSSTDMYSADPYLVVAGFQFGSVKDPTIDEAVDNIHNHFLEAR